jgi:methylmalonyl-CoA mutase C-terminal domain/subunit
LFRQNDLGNIPVILGGIIPDGDIGELKKMGVWEIFGPGTSTTEVAHYIQELLGREKNGRVKGNNH